MCHVFTVILEVLVGRLCTHVVHVPSVLVHLYLSVHMWGGGRILGVSLHHTLPHCLQSGSVGEPDVHHLARLSVPWALRACPAQLLSARVTSTHSHAWVWIWVLGIQAQALVLQSKHLSNRDDHSRPSMSFCIFKFSFSALYSIFQPSFKKIYVFN